MLWVMLYRWCGAGGVVQVVWYRLCDAGDVMQVSQVV